MDLTAPPLSVVRIDALKKTDKTPFRVPGVGHRSHRAQPFLTHRPPKTEDKNSVTPNNFTLLCQFLCELAARRKTLLSTIFG